MSQPRAVAGSLAERRPTRLLIGYSAVAVVLVAWELGGRASDTGLVPPVSDALAEAWALVSGPHLFSEVLPSVLRIIAGFVAGSIAGALLGILIGYFRALEPWTRPLLEFLRAIPPPALLPIAVLVLGATDMMRVMVIAVGAFWPVLLSATDGTRRVEPGYLDVARVTGLSSAETLWRVVLPAALPMIASGLRTALGIALVMMVISEMVAASSGLGYFVLQSQRTYALASMYAGIILLGLLGWLMTVVFLAIERRVLSWYEGQKGR